MQTLRRAASACNATINKQILRSTTKSTALGLDENTEHLKSWREIPGPSSLPIIGPMLQFLPGGTLTKLGPEVGSTFYKLYGPIVRLDGIFGSSAIIFLLDAESSCYILRNENKLPARPVFRSLEYFRKTRKASKQDSLTGLLTDHGEDWKKFRSTVSPILLQPKTIQLYATTLCEVAEDMITRMKSIRNEKNMLQSKFDVEMNLWALESLGVVALGGRLNCFDSKLPQDSPARRLIKNVHATFEYLNKLDFKPSLWRYISTPAYRKTMSLFEEQKELSQYFIRKAIEKLKKKEKASDDEKGVLEKLLDVDENVAVIMASDMLFAGIDTTANTVTNTLYLLALNQAKQNKLREEILSNDVKRIYLKACIKESLRLFPVVAGNLRQTTKEYNILGYKIPKEMFISFGHQYLCTLEEHFPRPSEYIPERWIVDKTDPLYYGNAHPFAYSPFGFGVRSCVGRRIASLEMETFLEKIIKNFQVEWFGPPPLIKATSINFIAGPYNFTFKDV